MGNGIGILELIIIAGALVVLIGGVVVIVNMRSNKDR